MSFGVCVSRARERVARTIAAARAPQIITSRRPGSIGRVLFVAGLAMLSAPSFAFAACPPAVTLTSTPFPSFVATITTSIFNPGGTGLFLNFPSTGTNNRVENQTSITAGCAAIEGLSLGTYSVANLIQGSISVTGLNVVDGILIDANTGTKQQSVENFGSVSVAGVNFPLTVTGIRSLSTSSSFNGVTNTGSILVQGSGILGEGIFVALGGVSNQTSGTITVNGIFNAAGGIVISGDKATLSNTGLVSVTNLESSGVSYGAAAGPGSVLGGVPATPQTVGSTVQNSGSIGVLGTTSKYVIGVSASPNSTITNAAGGQVSVTLISPFSNQLKGADDLYLAQGIAVQGNTVVNNYGSVLAATGPASFPTLRVGIGSLLGLLGATTDAGGNTVNNYGTVSLYNDVSTNAFGIALQSNNNILVNQASGNIIVAGTSVGMSAVGNNNALTNYGSIQNVPTSHDNPANLNFVGMVAGNFGNGKTDATNNQIYNLGTITSPVFGSVGMWLAGNGQLGNNPGGVINLTGQGTTGFVDASSGFSVRNIFNGAGNVGMIVYLPTDQASYPNTSSNANIANFNQVNVTSGVGVAVVGNGTVFTNAGVVQVQGAGSVGVGVVGPNNQILNGRAIGVISADSFAIMDSAQTSNARVTNLPGGLISGPIDLSHGQNETLTNQGTIQPYFGAPVGQQFIIGDAALKSGTFTQTSAGSLTLRIDSSGHFDKLTVNGTLNAGGTLLILPQQGNWTKANFDSTSKAIFSNLIDPPVVHGQFDQVQVLGSPFFAATAIYSANAIDIVLNHVPFNGIAGLTRNQFAVGGGLEIGWASATSANAQTLYNNLLFNLPATPGQAYDVLSGEGTSGTQNATFFANNLFTMSLAGQAEAWRSGERVGVVTGGGEPLGYTAENPVSKVFASVYKAPPAYLPSWRAWGTGFGGSQSVSGDPGVGSADLSDRTTGGALGFDYQVNPDLLLGFGTGATSSNFSVADRFTSGQIDGGQAGVYGMRRWGTSYISALVSFGEFNNSTTRTIAGVGPTEIAVGRFSSDQLGARLEFGNTWKLNGVGVTPFAAVQVSELWQHAYAENSVVAGVAPGVLGLTYAPVSITSLPTYLGVQFDTRVSLGNMIWSPFVRVAWMHEFFPSRYITAALISAPTASFTVDGAHAASDAATIDAGSRFMLSANAALIGSFHGEFAEHSHSYAGTAALRVGW